jgi:hypothetical protein
MTFGKSKFQIVTMKGSEDFFFMQVREARIPVAMRII